jgi:GDP-4-dehydro-6-deoxy-D-mannose reductase
VRAFNHTGPGQRAGFVCPEFAEQVIAAERAGRGSIRVGAAGIVRDFTDVRDVVAAYDALCGRGEPGRVYNVCSGVGRTIGGVAEALARLARVPVGVEADPARARPQAWDTPALVGDPARIRAATGWSPAIPFERTLADLLAGIRAARG